MDHRGAEGVYTVGGCQTDENQGQVGNGRLANTCCVPRKPRDLSLGRTRDFRRLEEFASVADRRARPATRAQLCPPARPANVNAADIALADWLATPRFSLFTRWRWRFAAILCSPIGLVAQGCLEIRCNSTRLLSLYRTPACQIVVWYK